MALTKDAPNINLQFVEVTNVRVWMTNGLNTDYIDSSPSGAFDVENPLSGWYDLGNVMAVRLPATKDIFDYSAGTPKTSRKQFEIGRTAQITFNLAELTPYAEAFITGQKIRNQLRTPDASSHVASLYTNKRTKVKLASTPVSGFDGGDMVVCGSPTVASLEDNLNITTISVSPIAGNIVEFSDFGFPQEMVVGDVVQKVDAIELIDKLGVVIVRSMIVFYDIVAPNYPDSVIQYALYYPRVNSFAGGELDFKDGAQPYEMSSTMAAQATKMTYSDGDTGVGMYKKFILQYT